MGWNFRFNVCRNYIMGATSMKFCINNYKSKAMRICYVYVSLIIFGMIFMSSCKKYDETYKQFIKIGERDYAQKPDSIKVGGGRNRVKLSWLILSDPSVTNYKIYWHNKRDSLSGDIKNTTGIDSVSVIINGLEEGIHYFDLYMYDKYGNSSIKTEVIGNVYGKVYQESLLDRTYNSTETIADSLVVNWNPSGIGIIGVQVRYLNHEGDSVTHFISDTVEIDTIPGISFDSDTVNFKYRTVFLPDSMAIDTFYTDYIFQKAIRKSKELDKGKWELYPLDNDIIDLHYSTRPISNLWDGSTSTSPPRIDNTLLPQWTTIDLGRKAVLTKVKMNFYNKGDRYLYGLGIPKEFEIWGSNNPSQDGDWASWNLLGHFEGARPSGLSSGDDLTPEDIEVGSEGLQFDFPEMKNDSAYRYIRLKTITTWNGGVNVWYSEMTLWGKE